MNIVINWQIAGALAFGLVLGWNVFFVNRYRRGDVSFGDLTTLVGAVGGAAVLALFPNNTDLFGAYGVGLGAGFFIYFIFLLFFVRNSPNFDSDWFLDGRRKNPPDGYGYATDTRPTLAPMAPNPATFTPPATPNLNIAFHGNNPAEPAMISLGPQPGTLALGSRSATLSMPNANATRVLQACAETWPRRGPNVAFNQTSAGYVIEVANRLGVVLSGKAEQIIEKIKKNRSWSELPNGPAAREAAAQGKFVIAGTKDAGAQMAVIAAGPMNPSG